MRSDQPSFAPEWAGTLRKAMETSAREASERHADAALAQVQIGAVFLDPRLTEASWAQIGRAAGRALPP